MSKKVLFVLFLLAGVTVFTPNLMAETIETTDAHEVSISSDLGKEPNMGHALWGIKNGVILVLSFQDKKTIRKKKLSKKLESHLRTHKIPFSYMRSWEGVQAANRGDSPTLRLSVKTIRGWGPTGSSALPEDLVYLQVNLKYIRDVYTSPLGTAPALEIKNTPVWSKSMKTFIKKNEVNPTLLNLADTFFAGLKPPDFGP